MIYSVKLNIVIVNDCLCKNKWFKITNQTTQYAIINNAIIIQNSKSHSRQSSRTRTTTPRNTCLAWPSPPRQSSWTWPPPRVVQTSQTSCTTCGTPWRWVVAYNINMYNIYEYVSVFMKFREENNRKNIFSIVLLAEFHKNWNIMILGISIYSIICLLYISGASYMISYDYIYI